MIVINFFGAPCAGKSTAASGLFNMMKRQGKRVEYVTEVAKDYIYSGSEHMLQDQLLILAEQEHKIRRLLDKNIDYAITDAPILFSAFYGSQNYPDSFQQLCLDLFNQYESINIFVHRSHEFNNIGRIHNEEESNMIHKVMHTYLINNNIPFVDISSGAATAETLAEYIKYYSNQTITHNG